MATDLNTFLDDLGDGLAEKITQAVMSNIRREIETRQAEGTEVCWSEEEAAVKLKMSVETLAKIRKAKGIGYTYAIQPTKWDGKGRPLNGRPVYMLHHLLSYLLQSEMKAASGGKTEVKFENVYDFGRRAA